jgi:hypothetical protein
MKINPVFLGLLVAICVFIVGLVLSEVFLNTEHKSFFELFWPPTVRWIAWIVIGIVVGNLVRAWAEKKER